MPKRKRNYSKRRKPYRRSYSSTNSVIRALAKAQQQIGPFGVPGSATMTRYGPSTRQMRKNPGLHREGSQNMNRILDRYYGDGAYDFAGLGRNIGHWGSRIGGSVLGAVPGMISENPLGAVEGAVAGWKSGAEFSKASGWGNYNVGRGSNDLVSPVVGNGSAPVYHSAGASDELGDVIISNRELVKIIKSSSTSKGYKVEAFSLNPADTTFHHLKAQAAQYEQFEFLGLMFQFVPMMGEGGDNELGVLGMATSYDPSHTRDFVSIEQMMRFKGATTCKPSVGMVYGVECDPAKRSIKTMYVRDNISRDKDFTDPGTFYIASDGVSGSEQVLGQLWVTYSVKLRNIKTDLTPIHPPLAIQQGVSWLSDQTSTGAAPAGSGRFSSIQTQYTPILSLTATSSTRFNVNLDPTICPEGTHWYCQMQATNNANAQVNQAFEPSNLVDAVFVPITSYAMSTVSNYYRASEASSDSQHTLNFKIKVTGPNPGFRITKTTAGAVRTVFVIRQVNPGLDYLPTADGSVIRFD